MDEKKENISMNFNAEDQQEEKRDNQNVPFLL